MVLVKIDDPKTKETYEFYVDDKLKNQLDKKVKVALDKKDEDYVLVIDGDERAGKSVFGMQLARYIDPSFSLDKVCFTPDEFRKAILNAKEKDECIIFDEAYRGLAAKGALTEVNRILVSLMMEMGQKNLFIIIILPTFYLLEKYVALWRARGLFHVFRSKGRKGYWVFYNKRKKKTLFLKGKKDYGYNYAKSTFRGRFYNKYCVDKDSYIKKKSESLKKGYKTTRQEKFKEQRDRLLYLIRKQYGLSLNELSNVCKLYDVRLKKTQLSDIIAKFKERP